MDRNSVWFRKSYLRYGAGTGQAVKWFPGSRGRVENTLKKFCKAWVPEIRNETEMRNLLKLLFSIPHYICFTLNYEILAPDYIHGGLFKGRHFWSFLGLSISRNCPVEEVGTDFDISNFGVSNSLWEFSMTQDAVDMSMQFDGIKQWTMATVPRKRNK